MTDQDAILIRNGLEPKMQVTMMTMTTTTTMNIEMPSVVVLVTVVMAVVVEVVGVVTTLAKAASNDGCSNSTSIKTSISFIGSAILVNVRRLTTG